MTEVSNKKIQKFILKNNDRLNTYEMAKALNVEPMRIGGNKAALKRQGLLSVADLKVKTDKAIDKLNSVLTPYQLKKAKGENTYINHNGENKEVARNKMANVIIDSGITGLIPTLPNTEWAIEQKVANGLNNVKFLGIECDEATYVAMRSNLKNTGLNAETYLGYFGDKVYGKIENSYAHLIMDYCGELHTISKEVEYAINNDLVVVGGCMCVTFAKPMRGTTPQAEKLKGLAAINNVDDRCMSDRAIEAYFNKVTGWNYEVVEFFYYQDTYPMTLVIIKRIK